MNIDDVLRDDPKFHVLNGRPISGWRLDDDTLTFLDGYLRAGMKTVETGCGISTVLFALKGAEHVCIVPDEGQVQRVTAYCQQKRISLERVRFIIERSELVLPGLKETGYGLALIDGRHGFPTPFIDWYYMSAMLQIGGVVIVDDIHVWTSDILKKYLLSEPDEWEGILDTTRVAIFKKRSEIAYGRDWAFQPFVRRRSAGRSKLAMVGQGIELLARGKAGLLPGLFAPELSRRVSRKIRKIRGSSSGPIASPSVRVQP